MLWENLQLLLHLIYIVHPLDGTQVRQSLKEREIIYTYWRFPMNNVTIRGLMATHKANRRSQNEQARELAHLRHRSYRGVPTKQNWITSDVHGNFVYRGVAYTK